MQMTIEELAAWAEKHSADIAIDDSAPGAGNTIDGLASAANLFIPDTHD